MLRRIWAIADTHLSFANPKPMDIFGPHWKNHADRISEQCQKLVGVNDLLLIPGDISWAMKRQAAEQDLAFIANLPGIKILSKGNHDYWWDSDKPLNYPGLYDTPYYLGNSTFGVAATRGWTSTTAQMTEQEKLSNQTIITREVKRLSRRLHAIDTCKIKLVMTHYPPLDEFREVLNQNNVTTVLYGHLHLGGSEHPLSENWHGIKAICVAADRINFTPKLVQTFQDGT